MVQQLRPAKTRSLVVEAAPAARPSLSLQIQFDFDSAVIRAQSLVALDNLAQAMQSTELAQTQFSVEGHTDAKGAKAYNQKLSEMRAQAVVEWLAAHGVQPTRLQSVGKGSSEPANAADPMASENRRVRIVNTGE
jgi:outer membrane protein OmpA-like peptidoglycan-associated protein